MEMSSGRLPVRLAKGRVFELALPVVWVVRAIPGTVSSTGFGLGRGCPGLVLHRWRRRLSGLALHLMYWGGPEPVPAAGSGLQGS